MPDQKSSKASDYVVGYRRPPKASQFMAGKSGNSKGRPKGSRPVGAILQDITQQKVAVTEKGKTRRIPAHEVMLRRFVNDAMRRDPRAMKLLLLLVDRYAELPETTPNLGDLGRRHADGPGRRDHCHRRSAEAGRCYVGNKAVSSQSMVHEYTALPP